MKKIYLPLILFILVIFEGLAIDLLPTQIMLSDYLIIAHWALMFLVYIAVYYDQRDTYYAVLYAVIFGLLIDITYTGNLGIYMFAYGLSIYLIKVLQKMLQRNLFVLILLGMIAIIISDVIIYIIFTVIGTIDMIWMDYLFIRLIPTLLANSLFLLILYPICKKKLKKWGEEQLSDSN